MKTIRIFVSSPSDLTPERQISVQVIDRLHNEFKHFFDLKPVFWEHEPLLATEHFQEGLISPDQCDIMLCMLWSTLGSPLPDNFSRLDQSKGVTGTEWEFEKAKQHFEEQGFPKILFYRKMTKITVDIGDAEEVKLAQSRKQVLDSFFNRHFHNDDDAHTFKNAYWPFESLDDFEGTLETHLRNLLKEIVSNLTSDSSEPQTAGKSITWYQGSPFRGLNSFDLEHAAIFFGRSRAKSQIFDQFNQQIHSGKPFLMTLGMSGSGKSSVIKAGVQPLLLSPKVIEGVAECRRATFKPSDSPGNLIEGIAKAIFSETALPEATPDKEAQDNLLRQINQSPHALETHIFNSLTFIKQIKQYKPIYSVKLLIVIDQFEELFTLPDISETERHALISLIHSLVSSGHTWVLATMRSDFFAQCEPYPELIELMLGNGQYHLAPPTGEEIEQMIVSPARAAGLSFAVNSDGVSLSQVLRERSSNQPSVLPLLSFTLDELYRRRAASNVLTFDAYDELGGLEGAIANRASTVFKTLNEKQKQAFDELLPSLITIHSEDSETVTARSVNMTFIERDPIRQSLVAILISERLLVSQSNRKSPESSTVRFTHEALLANWSRVKEWVQFNVEKLKTRARLASQARYWELSGNSDDELLVEGSFFDQVAALAKDKKVDLSDLELSFINHSEDKILELEAQRNLEAKKQQKFRQRLIAAASVAAVFVCVFIYQLYSNQQVQQSLQENKALQKVRMQDYVNAQLTKLAADEMASGNNEKAIELLHQTKPLDSYSNAYGQSRELLYNALNQKAILHKLPASYSQVNDGLLLIDSENKNAPFNLETNRYFMPRNSSFKLSDLSSMAFFSASDNTLVYSEANSIIESWNVKLSETNWVRSYSQPIIAAHHLEQLKKWLIITESGAIELIGEQTSKDLVRIEMNSKWKYQFTEIKNSGNLLVTASNSESIESIWLVDTTQQSVSEGFIAKVQIADEFKAVKWSLDSNFFQIDESKILVEGIDSSLDLIDLERGIFIDRLSSSNQQAFSVVNKHILFDGIGGNKVHLDLNESAKFYSLPIANGHLGYAVDKHQDGIYYINHLEQIAYYSFETKKTTNRVFSNYKFDPLSTSHIKMAVNEDIILISNPTTGLYCFDKKSQQLLWRKEFPYRLIELAAHSQYALANIGVHRLINLKTGKETKLTNSPSEHLQYDFSRHTAHVVSDSKDIKIISLLDGNTLFTQALDIQVSDINLLPNGNILLKDDDQLHSLKRTSPQQRYTQQYDVSSNKNDILEEHHALVEVKGREVHFYDTHSQSLIQTWLAPQAIKQIKTDKRHAYLQVGDQSIYRYELEKNSAEKVFTATNNIQKFDLFESQNKLVVYDDEYNLQIKSLDDGHLVTLNHWSELKEVFMQSNSLNNNQLVSLEENNSLNIWDIESGTLVNRVNIKGSIDKAAVSESGVVFVTRYSEDKSLLVDELTNNIVATLPHDSNDIADVILSTDYSSVTIILNDRSMEVHPLVAREGENSFDLLPSIVSASSVTDAAYADANQSLFFATVDVQIVKDDDDVNRSVIRSLLFQSELSSQEKKQLYQFDAKLTGINGVSQVDSIIELEFSGSENNSDTANSENLFFNFDSKDIQQTNSARIMKARIEHLALKPINTIALANLANQSDQPSYIPLSDDLITRNVVDIDTVNNRLLTSDQNNVLNVWSYRDNQLIAELQLGEGNFESKFENGGNYILLRGNNLLAYQRIFDVTEVEK